MQKLLASNTGEPCLPLYLKGQEKEMVTIPPNNSDMRGTTGQEKDLLAGREERNKYPDLTLLFPSNLYCCLLLSKLRFKSEIKGIYRHNYVVSGTMAGCK